MRDLDDAMHLVLCTSYDVPGAIDTVQLHAAHCIHGTIYIALHATHCMHHRASSTYHRQHQAQRRKGQRHNCQVRNVWAEAEA